MLNIVQFTNVWPTKTDQMLCNYEVEKMIHYIANVYLSFRLLVWPQ